VHGSLTFYEEESGACGVGPVDSNDFDFIVPKDGSRGAMGEIIQDDYCPAIPIGLYECNSQVDWFLSAHNDVAP
jgi:hypothetical protein